MLTRASFEGGMVHTRAVAIRSAPFAFVTWTQDSRRVLLSEGAKNAWRLLVVDPAGSGEPVPTGVSFEADTAAGITLSPDGRRLAISSRNRSTEAWALETR